MKTYYGVFYKSHGKWYGPYEGSIWETKEEAIEDMNCWKRGEFSGQPTLKSKCEVRKQKWVKA